MRTSPPHQNVVSIDSYCDCAPSIIRSKVHRPWTIHCLVQRERDYSLDHAERALVHTVKNKVEAACHRTDLLGQRHP